MNLDNTNNIDSKIHKIAKISEKDFLNSVNPINSNTEKTNFFLNLKKYSQYTPHFEYNPKKDYFKEIELLKDIKTELLGGLTDKLFLNRIKLLENEFDIIKKVNTPKFCNASKTQYGLPSKKEVHLAEEILLKKTIPEEKPLHAIDVQRELLNKLSKIGFKVTIEENMSARASVHLIEKKLKLNKNALFEKNSSKRLFIHEVETHIYRYLNGETQPLKIFSLGYGKDFLQTEEGLALFNQKESRTSSNEQEKRFARGAYAVNYALKHDFFDTFDEMAKYFPYSEAYEITQRVKRGIPSDRKGSFTKDHCYFTGLLKVTDYVQKVGQIKDLYYGKISTDEVKIVKKIKGIKKPTYFPKYLLKN